MLCFDTMYGSDGHSLGGKAQAVTARVQRLLQGPNGLKLGFSAFAVVVLLMCSVHPPYRPSTCTDPALERRVTTARRYFFVHLFNKDVLLIVSLFAELVRLFGVLVITVNLRSSGGGSKATNISLMSQKFYLVVFGTRLVFKLFYEDFDLIYVLVEASALVATGHSPHVHLPARVGCDTFSPQATSSTCSQLLQSVKRCRLTLKQSELRAEFCCRIFELNALSF